MGDLHDSHVGGLLASVGMASSVNGYSSRSPAGREATLRGRAVSRHSLVKRRQASGQSCIRPSGLVLGI